MANIKDKAKRAIADITRLLFGTEAGFTEAKLADGTVIQIEGAKPAVGAAILDADGNGLPDGTYKLEDTSVIIVEQAKIKHLTPPKEEEKKLTPVSPEKMRAMVYQFAAEAYNNKLASVDREITALKTANKNMSTAFVALMKVVQELADAPAAQAAEPVKSSFKRNMPDPAQRISEIAAVIENFKKNRN